MRDDVRYALAIGPSSKVEDRTIDITTTGRSSGSPLRIEIVFEPADFYQSHGSTGLKFPFT